jgi:hypothetical protein
MKLGKNLHKILNRPASCIAEGFRYGCKQMLSYIIKWTIIIIIATVVFVIVYKIATGLPFQTLLASRTELTMQPATAAAPIAAVRRPMTTFNRQQQNPISIDEISYRIGTSGTAVLKDFSGPAAQQQSQNKLNPISIIEDEFAFGQQQINRQFDQAKHELDIRTYAKPEEYLNAISELRQQSSQAGLQLRQKAEAKLLRMQQIMTLVDEKTMPSEVGQKAMWRIAGLDEEAIDAMFPETKSRNLMQEHADKH